MRLIVLCCLSAALLGADWAAVGVQERHGSWAGAPFWLRLQPADPAFDGARMLQLLYRPPAPAELGGCLLQRHPELLLDAQLRILAWRQDEDTLSGVWWEDGAYQLQREILQDEGPASVLGPDTLPWPAPVWDRRLAPILALLVDPAALPIRVPVVDLFRPDEPAVALLTLQPARLQIGERIYPLERDTAGAITRIRRPDGSVLLEVGPVPQVPLEQ